MPKMFTMKFPMPLLNDALVFSSNSVFPINTTGYLGVCEQAGLLVAYNATETHNLCNYLVTRPGIIKNLVAHTTSAPGVGETLTYTVRINGVPTIITCITAGAVRDSSDLVNSATVVIGDRITVQLISSLNAVAATHKCEISLTFPSVRIPFEHKSFTTWGNVTVGALTTTYLGFTNRALGVAVGTAPETNSLTVHRITRKGTLKNLVALSTVAPGLGQTFVYIVRVNGVNTALTVTISGAVAITANDTTNVVVVNPGDIITIQFATSAAATATYHITSLDFSEGDYRAG